MRGAARGWLGGLVLAVACGDGASDLPPGSLVDLRELPPGDVACPGGGVRIVTGKDDGAGGGVAGDGVLQDGEVDADRAVCDGADAGGSYLPLDPPAGDPGVATIAAAGGVGGHGGGGAGGVVELTLDEGSPRGHVGVFRTGALDDLPDPGPPPTIDLGANPLEVTGRLVIEEMPESTPRPLGTVYLGTGSTMLRIDDDQGDAIVTGIHVHPGGELVLPAPMGDSRTLIARSGIWLEGRLSMPSRNGADLLLQTPAFHGSASAEIDLRGQDGDADTPGTEGGGLVLSLGTSGSDIPFPVGALRMDGTIRTSGGDGRDGGDAGPIVLGAQTRVVVLGTLEARGGDALGGGVSGAGGPVEVRGDAGHTLVAGTIDTSGGSGGAWGGRGGDATIRGARIDSRAVLRARGGDGAVDCATRCSGAPGGTVALRSGTGAVRHAGTVDARGGAGHGDVDGGGDGARGGNLVLDTGIEAPSTTRPIGSSVELAGDVLLGGGDGPGTGGGGGRLAVRMGRPSDDDASVRLYGYATVDLHGGDTARGPFGGDGGRVVLEARGVAAAGGITFWPDVDLHAGHGVNGGEGGSFEARSSADDGRPDAARAVELHGAVDVDGGDGDDAGGGSGLVALEASFDVALHGDVTGRSGVSGRGNGRPAGRALLGEAGLTLLSLRATAANHGHVVQRGGDGVAAGGGGGNVQIRGATAVHDGTIEATGGTSVEGQGGRGGFVVIASLEPPSWVTGTFWVAPGDGATVPGAPGQVWIDGVGGRREDAP